MSNLSLLSLPLPRLLFCLLSLRLFELIEITSVIVQFLPLELNNLVDDLVQEVTGVRNNDYSDWQICDILFQPNQCHKIKMIRWLIE